MSCSGSNYLQTLVGPAQCLTTCPLPTIPDLSTHRCIICDASCASCSGPGPGNCMSCLGNNYLQSPFGPSQCLSTCPLQTYSDISTHICQLCDSTCATCSTAGSNYCLSCKPNFFLQTLTGPAQCLSNCPSHTYPDTLTNVCQNCDISCETCQNSGSDFCQSCNGTKMLQSSTGPSQCLTSCPTHTFACSSPNICKSCDSTCQDCLNEFVGGCISCPSGKFLNSLDLPTSCVNACTSGYYGDNSNQACSKCESLCKECFSNSFNCTSCFDGFYYDYNFSSSLGSCKIHANLLSTENPLIYNLTFSTNYSYLYAKYINATTISITNIMNSSYSFYIHKINNVQIFQLVLFNVSVVIPSDRIITMSLNPPNFILTSPIQLQSYILSNNTQYFSNFNSSQTWQDSLVNITKDVNDALSTGGYVAAQIALLNSPLTAYTLIAMDCIQLLRYYLVDYPQIDLDFFSQSMPTSQMTPTLRINEDPADGQLPDSFQNYNVSIYAFNGNGSYLIEGTSYFLLAYLLKLFRKRFSATRRKGIKYFIVLSSIIFIWCLPLSFFISNCVNIFFPMVLIYRYHSFETTFAKFDFAYSVGLGVAFSIFICFLFRKMKQIRNIIEKEKNFSKVTPFSDNVAKQMADRSPTIGFSQMNFSSASPALSPMRVHPIKQESPLETMNKSEIPALSPMRVFPAKQESPPEIFSKTEIFSKNITINKLARGIIKKTMVSDFQINSFFEETSPIKEDHFIPPEVEEPNKYRFMHISFHHKLFLQIIYVPLTVIFQMGLITIAIFFYDQPYYALAACITWCPVLISFNLFLNPYKSKVDLFHELFNNLCVLACYGFAFYMSYMDKNNIFDADLKANLGFSIVGANALIILLFLIRTVAAWLKIIVFFIKLICKIFLRKFKRRNAIFDEKSANKDEDEGDEILEKLLELEGVLKN